MLMKAVVNAPPISDFDGDLFPTLTALGEAPVRENSNDMSFFPVVFG